MKKSGDGRRIERVQKEVQQILSRFLMGSFKGDLPGIVTITQVTMPADLRQARVEISVLGGTAAQNEEAVEALQERSAEMQRYLADHLPLRYTPKIKFFADQSLEKVMKIDRLLHEIKKEKSSESVKDAHHDPDEQGDSD